MSSPPCPAPSRQDDPYGPARVHSRASPTAAVCLYQPQNEPTRTPRSVLRSSPSYMPSPHDQATSPSILRPHPLPIPRSTTASPYHHHHTASSPELRPRVDNAWAPRVRACTQQHPPDPAVSAPNIVHSSSHIIQRPRVEQDDAVQKRSGFAARVSPHFVPGIRGRSASDVRLAHTPPPDLEPDRLARACGQPAPISAYRHHDRLRQGVPPIDMPPSRLRDLICVDHPLPPKARIGQMYRRLDALARRSGNRAMDFVIFEDVVAVHKRDSHLREQLRRKRSERLQEKDPSFHAIGAPLEDVILYASTPIVIGDYQHHIPFVVIACIEELTKTGIYQSGLFRALPSRDRHLQLIDLYDKSADFGAQFRMRGQAMPDICALLSTFISSLPAPLLDPYIYSALWHWSVKPSVKRQDARRDLQEEGDENLRTRGETPSPNVWSAHTDLYLDDTDISLEGDQISISQILLRFLPSPNLSLLVYLCGFFTQLPLCPENGLQLEDVARIFGFRLLGGSVKTISQRMMMWLLTRWHRISENLFGDVSGLTPPSSPAHPPLVGGSAVSGEGRLVKRKGKPESGSDDALRHAPSSSSSLSSTTEDRGVSSRKSSSPEDDGESSEGSRQRKKRELDVHEPRTNAQIGPRSSTRKQQARHGHGHGRRTSGSRRHHHHGRPSEHKNAPASPDPFALAFAKAQLDLADSPLLTPPPGGGDINESEPREPASRFAVAHLQRLVDTPVRVAWRFDDNDDSGRRRTAEMDARVVDALLQETAAATGAARALAERVEALERVLQAREVQAPFPIVPVPPQVNDDGEGEERRVDEDDKTGSEKDVEDELRLQLRLVEAERDKAQRIARDVRAYLMDGGGS